MLLEIQRDSAGRVLARRRDGAPLGEEDRKEARFTAELEDKLAEAPGARVAAILIASEVLGCDLWLAFDKSFKTDDGLAVYYPEELPVLKNKTPSELRLLHQMK